MKAICIHGHFYQPPREDPLTGKVPVEPGSAPYRNWNERIHAECYRPNAELGNFERISFNIGPTLFSWMAGFDPETAGRIAEQDQKNVRRYGVGNAMAQSYHHTILPLANRLDKVTQVRWGMADFRHRFGRVPRGMWLPETAADEETLSVLAEEGIEFTILAPWQSAEPVDTTQAYRVTLPEGKQLSVFFYNQDLSTRISFDPSATVNADHFLRQMLVPRYRTAYGSDDQPQMILVASDGELYGHHQTFRDKFLAYLLNGALGQVELKRMFPELWLKEYPAQTYVGIQNGTSWSCHHGVRRWSGECGCTPRGSWKAPLRDALNTIGDALNKAYEDELAAMQISNGWELRHQYIQVLLGQRQVDDLIQSHAGRKLDLDVLQRIRRLLESQVERQRMFTSCGWFFEDFDRIEPKNNLSYAAQAVWLVRKAGGPDLVPGAVEALRAVKSWRSGISGADVFKKTYTRAQQDAPAD